MSDSDRFKRVREPIDKILGIGGWYKKPADYGGSGKNKRGDREAAKEMWERLSPAYTNKRYGGDFERYVREGGY